MDDKDRPNLSLGDLTTITDERYVADHAAWDALRPLLKPKGWSEKTRFVGPRPPKETAKFYLILSNYSTEVFFLEAGKYPRYPPNPHSQNWFTNLAKRTEDHVIGVVRDIEVSNAEKDFSYHDVAEDEMRKTIQQRLGKEMRDRFPVEFPRSIPPPLPPHVQRQMLVPSLTPERLRRSGIDPENARPLVQELIGLVGGKAENPLAPPKEERSFGEELDRLLLLARTTPERMAEMIDVDPTTVYRHKSGKFSPTRTTIAKYEKALSDILDDKVQLPTPVKRQRTRKRQ